MRRPDRNIEIFSMSVLDMFASALGAFIMISAILFPYYNQTRQLEKVETDLLRTEETLSNARGQLKRAQDESRQQQEEIQRARAVPVVLQQCWQSQAACREALTKTFLVIAIEWEEPCDVDLYVTDPSGHEFSFRNKTFPNSEGQLSQDNTTGPGTEVWQNPSAQPGDYKVVYNVLGLKSPNVTVKGWIIERGAGKRALPDKILRPSDNMVSVATVRLERDGSTVIRPAGN